MFSRREFLGYSVAVGAVCGGLLPGLGFGGGPGWVASKPGEFTAADARELARLARERLVRPDHLGFYHFRWEGGRFQPVDWPPADYSGWA